MPKPQDDDTKTSRMMSRVLRHKAKEFNLEISEDGYVSVESLLQISQFRSRKIVLDDIKRVVDNDKKQRYTVKWHDNLSGYFIRANQGHSMDLSQLELKPLLTKDDFPTGKAIHGTTLKAWNSGIKVAGLCRMNRMHIHFAIGLPGENGVISGMRSSAATKVMIYIDIEKALKSGIEFFMSSNNVILSPGNKEGYIPREMFLRVEGVDQGEIDLNFSNEQRD